MKGFSQQNLYTTKNDTNNKESSKPKAKGRKCLIDLHIARERRKNMNKNTTRKNKTKK